MTKSTVWNWTLVPFAVLALMLGMSSFGFRASADSTCGDEVVDEGEQCDDGNTVSGDGCTDLCVLELCGDGIVQESLYEQCDDGNTEDGDGCSSLCVSDACGDGDIDEGEACDDGNTEDGDGCGGSCQEEFCGDGMCLGSETTESCAVDCDPEYEYEPEASASFYVCYCQCRTGTTNLCSNSNPGNDPNVLCLDRGFGGQASTRAACLAKNGMRCQGYLPGSGTRRNGTMRDCRPILTMSQDEDEGELP